MKTKSTMQGFTIFVVLFTLTIDVIAVTSTKKGVAMSPKRTFCDDLKPFDNVKWWYDWRLTDDWLVKECGSDYNPHGIERVPMQWGALKGPIKNFPKDAKYFLGFNEPNHIAEANILPKDAARMWRDYIQDAVPGDVKLVSPSAAPCGKCNMSPTKWFDEFFDECGRDCRVEYLATHIYSCNADQTMAYLEGLWQRYKKEIWVTEFACPYAKSTDIALEYMAKILPMLEDAKYIFRYSWYVNRLWVDGFITRADALENGDFSFLRRTGQYYNDYNPPKPF
ncbi:unnamed protein product [Owenia fusiformis]|uniref:Asl1-like glycosyl hydrolase catalytic domain-containing protein n=1 Tax=Owenia fusiformis TaxID=6347 RepID=A0A8J1XUM7_OWEFU|nr:unnamed protein product [Owenia fusiformis]